MDKRAIIMILGLLAGGLTIFFWKSEPNGGTQQKVPSEEAEATKCLGKPGSPESGEPLSREPLERLESIMGRSQTRSGALPTIQVAYALAGKIPKVGKWRGLVGFAVCMWSILKSWETEAKREERMKSIILANGRGVARDKTEAMKWFRKADAQGYAWAQYNLGDCYANGDGVAQDKAGSAKWYRKAAEQGLAEAQYNLGVCYAVGDGVAQDMAEAVKLYLKAAKQGLVQAQFNLALCYDVGYGVAQDTAEAVKWYRKAAGQGYQPAKEKLDALQK